MRGAVDVSLTDALTTGMIGWLVDAKSAGTIHVQYLSTIGGSYKVVNDGNGVPQMQIFRVAWCESCLWGSWDYKLYSILNTFRCLKLSIFFAPPLSFGSGVLSYARKTRSCFLSWKIGCIFKTNVIKKTHRNENNEIEKKTIELVGRFLCILKFRKSENA